MIKEVGGHNVLSRRSQIEIRLLDTVDKKRQLKFLSSNLTRWEQFRSIWDWRQKGLPHSGGETAVIAMQQKDIVGCVGIVPTDVTLNGTRIKASWQQDSLVAPSMRGRGLGKRLVNEGTKGWDLVMAKGTNKPMYGLRKSLGFLDVPNSDYLVKVCKPRPKAENLKKRLAEYVLSLWNKVLPMPKGDSTLKIQEIEMFDPSFDVLSDKLHKDHVVRTFKGHDYLNWRYFQCPRKEYKVFRAGGNQADGAIVLNITGSESDEGWIVDLICPSSDYQCAYSLLNAAVNYFEAQGVSRCWVFATLPAARKWLYRFGYLPTKRTPRFTYRVQQKYLNEKSIDSAKWDFWHGDGDLELYQ